MGSCEMIAVHIEKINVINIVIYRPPGAIMSEFSPILEEVEKILVNMKKPNPTVIITGDFNFPSVEWKWGQDGGCRWKLKKGKGDGNLEVIQFMKLNDITDRYSLVQVIEEHTHKHNTLDLVFTNEVEMILQVDVTHDLNFSDHSRIELTTYIKNNDNRKTKSNGKCQGVSLFEQLKFMHKDRDWVQLNREIDNSQREAFFNRKDAVECMEILMKILEIVC